MMSISDTTVSTPARRRRGHERLLGPRRTRLNGLGLEARSRACRSNFLIELFRHEVDSLMDRTTPCEKVAGLVCFMSWLTSNMHMIGVKGIRSLLTRINTLLSTMTTVVDSVQAASLSPSTALHNLQISRSVSNESPIAEITSIFAKVTEAAARRPDQAWSRSSSIPKGGQALHVRAN